MNDPEEVLALEWQRVSHALQSYIEHPEQHTAIIFLRGRMHPQTRERLEREKGLVIGKSPLGEFQMISRAPGNTGDALAKEPQ